MKTFRIKDEEGKEYSVEELNEVTTEEVMPEKNDSSLSDEEIASLKKLAAVADKLVALTETTDEVDPEVKEQVNEVLEDEDEDCDKEEIVDTDEEDDECEKMHDSINSLEKHTSTNDSVDVQDEISSAWAKRYGGNK